ncbi:amidoligase enzyme [Mycobacterium sp. JS623]|uniref:amidoligase enzyme n=1 Tax=Mycobacterium sp. JS623 TaxID=212767 RepID=UPI0018DF8DEC|nr:amidoligase enzyme [Mycobacterium sp. JS623]
MLFGVELEVGGRESRIVDVVQTYDPCEDHLYMKHDSSIDGVEIVTHPMTLAWAREYPFENLLADLRAHGCDVGDEYGLHIHVSRNAFRRHGKQSCAHQMMWLLFMYRNVEDLTLLARRESCRWASFTTPVPGELARKATGVDHGDRYVAVNCRNEKTFELRFFAATLHKREFLAALEFADASVQYTQTLRINEVLAGDALTWTHFSDWLETRNYPNLSAEIEYAS